ncbi:DNA-directed RNA polymerase subunit beta', partial [Patescibacteria group bacterium]
MHHKEKTNPNNDFDIISLKLASPEDILSWSSGQVMRPETINYRTQRSEKGGLFDEKIFGPEKDYECYCGKYRSIRYKGITCEKCGVDVVRSVVRRERMGHIELAAPVSHIWFLRSIPSRLSLVLGITAGELEKVIYFASYIITKVDEAERERVISEINSEYKSKMKTLDNEQAKEKLKEIFTNTKKEVNGIFVGQVLDENTFHKYSMKYGPVFTAEIGAEPIYDMCK